MMDLKEVKKVIDCSIYNPTMRKDAKDFVDGLVEEISNLKLQLAHYEIAADEAIAEEAALHAAKAGGE